MIRVCITVGLVCIREFVRPATKKTKNKEEEINKTPSKLLHKFVWPIREWVP